MSTLDVAGNSNGEIPTPKPVTFRQRMAFSMLIAFYPFCFCVVVASWLCGIVVAFVNAVLAFRGKLAHFHSIWGWYWREVRNPGIHRRELINQMMPTNQRQEHVV